MRPGPQEKEMAQGTTAGKRSREEEDTEDECVGDTLVEIIEQGLRFNVETLTPEKVWLTPDRSGVETGVSTPVQKWC